jgi:uncharacterized lipoprotein YddW (UPF0748 family)
MRAPAAVLLMLSALLLGGGARAQIAPPRLDAITRNLLTTPEGIRQAVEAEKARHADILVVTALDQAEAWYLGGAALRAEALAGQPESFDPLQTAIDLGHAAGLKVYARFSVGTVWNADGKPKSPAHVVNAHPGWLLTERGGTALTPPGRKGISLDPGSPAARAWIHDIVLDAAKRYSVDGIVLDDLDYPDTEMGFSDEDLAQFRAMSEPDLPQERKDALALLPERDVWTRMFPAKWAQWRRDNVTGILRSIYRDVKAAKPGAVVAASVTAQGPVAAWEDSQAYNAFSQDWFGWMQEGIVDAVILPEPPARRDEYEGWIKAAVANRHNALVWVGIGAWLPDATGDVEKVKAARAPGAQGESFFSYGSLVGADPDAVQKANDKLDALKKDVYQTPAAVPDFDVYPPAPVPAASEATR